MKTKQLPANASAMERQKHDKQLVQQSPDLSAMPYRVKVGKAIHFFQTEERMKRFIHKLPVFTEYQKI